MTLVNGTSEIRQGSLVMTKAFEDIFQNITINLQPRILASSTVGLRITISATVSAKLMMGHLVLKRNKSAIFA